MSCLNMAETWTHQCEIRIWGTFQKSDAVKMHKRKQQFNWVSPNKIFLWLYCYITKVVIAWLFSHKLPSIPERAIMDGKPFFFTSVRMNQQSDLADGGGFPLHKSIYFSCVEIILQIGLKRWIWGGEWSCRLNSPTTMGSLFLCKAHDAVLSPLGIADRCLQREKKAQSSTL